VSEEVASVEIPVGLHRRVARGMRHIHNWVQFLRFAVVGASGYVVNLAVFWLAFDAVGVDHRAAATAAFAVAVTNNFLWNRYWTFDAAGGHAGFQAARFLAVSLAAFLLSLAVLELLVSVVGVPELPAQATAIVCATPLNFIGNRLWSFRI
jgi:putative flippase GtrA